MHNDRNKVIPYQVMFARTTEAIPKSLEIRRKKIVMYFELQECKRESSHVSELSESKQESSELKDCKHERRNVPELLRDTVAKHWAGTDYRLKQWACLQHVK